MATTNVIALPTAAKRKVRQCPSRTKAADWEALTPFPMRDIVLRQLYPEQDREQARLMLAADNRSIMRLALAMFRVLDGSQKARVEGDLRLEALREQEGATAERGAASAVAWVMYARAGVKRQRHLSATAHYILNLEGGDL